MGAWLDRLKIQKAPDTHATKPTKPTADPVAGGFVGFVAYPQGHFEKFEGANQQPDTQAANDPAPDPDCHCWPRSSAWNTSEVELFNRRAALFVRRGASDTEAERLVEKLVQRDREGDSMHACMECRHLQTSGAWRCGNWQAADVAVRAGDAGLARIASTNRRSAAQALRLLPCLRRHHHSWLRPCLLRHQHRQHRPRPPTLAVRPMRRRNPDRVCQIQEIDCQ